jgi:hypothetical protein
MGLIRLADGRSVGFAYGGTRTAGGRMIADIGVDIGVARRQWLELGQGESRTMETFTVEIVRINRGAGEDGDSADVQVTVAPSSGDH